MFHESLLPTTTALEGGRIMPMALDKHRSRQHHVQSTRHNPGLGIMSQRVHGDILIEAGRLGSVMEDPLQRSSGNRLQRIGAGKEPMGRLGSLPIVAQDAE